MPKGKKKSSYVIVQKPGAINFYGSFERTRDGLVAAKFWLKRIQKEYPDKLFIEKR